MASRLLAGLVLLGGIALLLVVTLRDDDALTGPSEETALETAPTTDTDTPPTSGAKEPGEDLELDPDPQLAVAPENLGPRRDLVDLDGWLNTDITSLSDLDGKVVLVEMWTFGCHNCKARIPHTQELYANTSREDFEIVGVHAPEFSYEADVANIEAALVDLDVTWPVALDTDKTNFRSWQDGGRRFWPRTYVIDQNGDVRYDHIGEGKYEELSQTVNWLIANPPT